MAVTELDKIILTLLISTPTELNTAWMKNPPDFDAARAYLADVGFPDPDVGLQVLQILNSDKAAFGFLAKTLQANAGVLIPYPIGEPHPMQATVKALFKKIHT
jgi:hypothetical protein